MAWLNKIFKGSSHRISEGQNVGNYREEHVRDAPSTPPVILLYSFFFKNYTAILVRLWNPWRR